MKFTQAGKALCTFTVMTSRSKKTDTGWEDTDVTAWRVSVWDTLAEHCADSLVKGTSVIVSGNAATREWEDKNGNKVSRIEVTAQDVAVSLRRGRVSVSKVERRSVDEEVPF